MGATEGLYLLNTGMRGADLAATQAAYAYAGIGAPALRSDEVPMVKIAQFSMGEHVLSGLAAAFGFFEQSQTSEGSDSMACSASVHSACKGFVLDYETQHLWIAP